MAGITFLGRMMRTTSRLCNQACPGIRRNMAKDITHSKRMLPTIASLTGNACGLSTNVAKKVVINYSLPLTTGSVSTIMPLLIGHGSSTDILECLGSDDEADTWSSLS